MVERGRWRLPHFPKTLVGIPLLLIKYLRVCSWKIEAPTEETIGVKIFVSEVYVLSEAESDRVCSVVYQRQS